MHKKERLVSWNSNITQEAQFEFKPKILKNS